MKTTIKTLLIAALTSVLCYAQEATPTPTPTPAQALVAQLVNSKTVAEVAALEIAFAQNLSSFSKSEISGIAERLYQAYARCAVRKEVVGGYWTIAVIPRYTPDWDNGLSYASATYYAAVQVSPALNAALRGLSAAKTPAQFDAVVNAYFAANVYPERFQARCDSRKCDLVGLAIPGIALASARVGHPQAINWSLLNYRLTSIGVSETASSNSIAAVGGALKAKDFNLTRANVWIEGQNTGTPACVFTDAEKALPTPLVGATFLPDVTVATAKETYRAALTAKSIDKGIYAIATALKAIDLNLSRANAWIAAQKDGTPFELP